MCLGVVCVMSEGAWTIQRDVTWFGCGTSARKFHLVYNVLFDKLLINNHMCILLSTGIASWHRESKLYYLLTFIMINEIYNQHEHKQNPCLNFNSYTE